MLCRMLHHISRALCYRSRQASSTTIVLDGAVIVEDDTGYQLGLFLLDGSLLCLRNWVPEQKKEYLWNILCLIFQKVTKYRTWCGVLQMCCVLKQCLSRQHICSTALIPVWWGTQVRYPTSELFEIIGKAHFSGSMLFLS